MTTPKTASEVCEACGATLLRPVSIRGVVVGRECAVRVREAMSIARSAAKQRDGEWDWIASWRRIEASSPQIARLVRAALPYVTAKLASGGDDEEQGDW